MPKTDPAREALLTALEASGVHIPLWDGILIEDTVAIAPGATILPGCILRGKTTVAVGSVIGPGSVLTDAVIGESAPKPPLPTSPMSAIPIAAAG